MASLILTVVGPDRPGLVNMLSHAVAARGGSWLESRMARLAGQFAGIVRVEAPESLLDDLPALEREGLRIAGQLVGAEAPTVRSGEALALEVVGNDRPGIVRDVTAILAGSGVNIEELATHVEDASFSGGTLFRAVARLRAPTAASIDAVRTGLETLGNDLMVDIRPAADTTGTDPQTG
ncbi:glycine cleavage system protein R [Rhodopila sp.]|jgi:glycine cleavage system regulatory protein|uniref:glycine cleavage system protein R n=1 Tax=Rhodopila sp. TaxID=2480087 RepID=UPI002CCF7C4E|nr:ACT domain-containing protein [Rhodopila sp.]HVZ09155.1 ACT domain-containing protein [Rhodopila sp.]